MAPASNTQLSEFIELYNPTGADVDLSNWRLAKGVDFVFPPGTNLPAGGWLVSGQDLFKKWQPLMWHPHKQR